MKKLILLLAVAVVFSCSKDNVTTEAETTADLTQMTPKKGLDTSSEGMYYGVFGHNSNQDLHGKIFINVGNDNNYTAQIDLVNGDRLTFQGNGLNETSLHFTGQRGSFDFNVTDYNAPVASNVMIDQETEGYITVKKSTSRGIGIVILGAYAETGNEANFYGNWDIFLTEVPATANNDNNQRGGGGSPYVFDVAVVSHKGNRGPFIDTSFEDYAYCIGFFPPLLVDIPGDGSWFDIWCEGQTSMFAGHPSNWNIKVIPGFHGDYIDYFSPLDLCTPASTGSWSWAGRSGTIVLLSHIPIGTLDATEGNDHSMASPYTF